LVVQHYKKSNKVYITFIDEIVLLVAKGLFLEPLDDVVWFLASPTHGVSILKNKGIIFHNKVLSIEYVQTKLKFN
jgi:hypothetical protein